MGFVDFAFFGSENTYPVHVHIACPSAIVECEAGGQLGPAERSRVDVDDPSLSDIRGDPHTNVENVGRIVPEKFHLLYALN